MLTVPMHRHVRPVEDVTFTELWKWISNASNQAAVDQVKSLPPNQQERVLRSIYQVSVDSYNAKKLVETNHVERCPKSDSKNTGVQPAQKRSRSQSPRPSAPNPPVVTTVSAFHQLPPFLESRVDRIGLASFFRLESFLLEKLAEDYSGGRCPLNSTEEAPLLMLLATLNLLFAEKAGQTFYIVDGSACLCSTSLDPPALQAQLFLSKAQSRLCQALLDTTAASTPENLATLTSALHMGDQNLRVLFCQEVFDTILDKSALEACFARHRTKILTHYAALKKGSDITVKHCSYYMILRILLSLFEATPAGREIAMLDEVVQTLCPGNDCRMISSCRFGLQQLGNLGFHILGQALQIGHVAGI